MSDYERAAETINAGRRGMLIATNQLARIPCANLLHADRYDTEDEHVIHLWDDAGHSWDLWMPREKHLQDVEPL